MSTRDKPWAQGTPCWVDAMVADVGGARDFYGRLFGWGLLDTPTEAGGYLMAELSGRRVAGIGPVPPDSQLPPVWSTYLAVDDVDAVASMVTEHGGQMFMEPMDVFDSGRMAVAADPTGAVFGMWQAKDHLGAGAVNEPGALTWNECMTRDYDRARNFYAAVFGYALEEVGDGQNFKYSVLNLDGRAVGGLGELGPDMPADIPPHWMVYFDVVSTDATIERAIDLGGQVRVPAMDTPYGRMAVLEGAQGEIFSVIESTQATG